MARPAGPSVTCVLCWTARRGPRARYVGYSIQAVPLNAVVPGDLLLIAPGDLVPVGGGLAAPLAIVDESALTGEPRPVERGAGGPCP